MVVVVLILFLLLPFADAQSPACDNTAKYTPNSTYEANLRIMSSILPMNTSIKTNRFATATAGNAPDRVYALTLCRGDMDVTYCASCAAAGFQDAQRLCPFHKKATVYYDQCMLTFSNTNFLANILNEDTLYFTNTQNFSTGDSASARHFLFMLLNITAQSAANSTRRFSTSFLNVTSVPTLYCVAQCTPDLSAGDCSSCLQGFLTETFQYLDGRQGGRIVGTRCNMRFEEYQYFGGDTMLRIDNMGVTVLNPKEQQPSASPPPNARTDQAPDPEHLGRTSRKSSVRIIAISAALLSVLLCLVFSFVWMRRRRKAAVNRSEEDALVWRLEENNSDFTVFDFSQILNATSNFSEDNCLGQGGFGSVYKGQLPDGIDIAVKRLATHSGQGFTEFKTEVELIAKLQHNNLVRLLGCCIQREEKLLVYEYLPNKSLDFFIFGGNRSTILDWNKCCAIIEGISQGLLYLHKHSRLRVIHRDLKASNILLDQDMNPKISDFGIARIFSLNEKQGNTKRVVGTYGYMSPEYASEGIYSIKSDVFSYGVLLLEILSGKRNSGNRQYGDFLNLLGYAWQLWECGRWFELFESSIAKEIHQSVARKYINIVLMCVQENADDRPTMSDVVTMLSSDIAVLPEPKHPAYFNLRVSKVVESECGDEICSVNCVTITDNEEGR